ncbi:hypothetical protein AOLI_G00200170 [Acnodon oligacanthus]
MEALLVLRCFRGAAAGKSVVLDLSISPRTCGENSRNRCSRRRKRSSLCSGLHELPAKVNRGKKKLNISDFRSSLCSGLHELPAKVNRGKKKLNISDVRND